MSQNQNPSEHFIQPEDPTQQPGALYQERVASELLPGIDTIYSVTRDAINEARGGSGEAKPGHEAIAVYHALDRIMEGDYGPEPQATLWEAAAARTRADQVRQIQEGATELTAWNNQVVQESVDFQGNTVRKDNYVHDRIYGAYGLRTSIQEEVDYLSRQMSINMTNQNSTEGERARAWRSWMSDIGTKADSSFTGKADDMYQEVSMSKDGFLRNLSSARSLSGEVGLVQRQEYIKAEIEAGRASTISADDLKETARPYGLVPTIIEAVSADSDIGDLNARLTEVMGSMIPAEIIYKAVGFIDQATAATESQVIEIFNRFDDRRNPVMPRVREDIERQLADLAGRPLETNMHLDSSFQMYELMHLEALEQLTAQAKTWGEQVVMLTKMITTT